MIHRQYSVQIKVFIRRLGRFGYNKLDVRATATTGQSGLMHIYARADDVRYLFVPLRAVFFGRAHPSLCMGDLLKHHRIRRITPVPDESQSHGRVPSANQGKIHLRRWHHFSGTQSR